MKTANFILCILNVLCLVYNLSIANYIVAAINAIAIVSTANAVLDY